MLKIVKSEEHPLMEIVNVCLIQFYHVTGNVNQATQLSLKNLEIQKKMYGDMNSSVFTTYEQITDLYYGQGLAIKALEYIGKCKQILQMQDKTKTAEYIQVLTKESDMLRGLDRYEECLKLCKEAEDINKALFPDSWEKNLQQCHILFNYYSYEVQRNNKKWVGLIDKCIAISSTLFGDMHSQTKNYRMEKIMSILNRFSTPTLEQLQDIKKEISAVRNNYAPQFPDEAAIQQTAMQILGQTNALIRKLEQEQKLFFKRNRTKILVRAGILFIGAAIFAVVKRKQLS